MQIIFDKLVVLALAISLAVMPMTSGLCQQDCVGKEGEPCGDPPTDAFKACCPLDRESGKPLMCNADEETGIGTCEIDKEEKE